MQIEKQQPATPISTPCPSTLRENHEQKGPFRILFVCLGNICRSPAAQAIMQHLIDEHHLSQQLEVDSAGTYGGHAGELPDGRMRQHAARRGYQLTHRSRPVNHSDFEKFDLLIGMDDHNLSTLRMLAPDVESQQKIGALTHYCSRHTADHVPDPYYGGASGFDRVLDLLEDGCQSMLAQWRSGALL